MTAPPEPVAPAATVHRYMPLSPCGEGCMAAEAPVVPVAVRVLRAAGMVGMLFFAVLLAPVLPLLGGRGRTRAARVIFRGMLRATGARLDVHGEFPSVPRGALVVSNHVSWLDIVAVNAVRPMRALAKKEVGEWPVVGRLAAGAGTVFLDRNRLRPLPGTVAELAGVLRSGALVHVMPEGTTWCGLGSGRFRPAMFQAAIDGGVPVRPVSLRYELADGTRTTWPAFVGEETVLDSVRRVLRMRGLVVRVSVLDEIAPGTTADRRRLAALAENRITAPPVAEEVVRIPRREWLDRHPA